MIVRIRRPAKNPSGAPVIVMEEAYPAMPTWWYCRKNRERENKTRGRGRKRREIIWAAEEKNSIP